MHMINGGLKEKGFYFLVRKSTSDHQISEKYIFQFHRMFPSFCMYLCFSLYISCFSIMIYQATNYFNHEKSFSFKATES